jgi:hypothetical protein
MLQEDAVLYAYDLNWHTTLEVYPGL